MHNSRGSRSASRWDGAGRFVCLTAHSSHSLPIPTVVTNPARLVVRSPSVLVADPKRPQRYVVPGILTASSETYFERIRICRRASQTTAYSL